MKLNWHYETTSLIVLPLPHVLILFKKLSFKNHHCIPDSEIPTCIKFSHFLRSTQLFSAFNGTFHTNEWCFSSFFLSFPKISGVHLIEYGYVVKRKKKNPPIKVRVESWVLNQYHKIKMSVKIPKDQYLPYVLSRKSTRVSNVFHIVHLIWFVFDFVQQDLK